MTRSKFDAFVTKRAVTDAWKAFWKNGSSQTASGVDGITPQVFAKSAERHIEQIFRDLRSGYIFRPLRPFAIEKSNGKKRIICIGTVRDRIVQRMIADYLTERAESLGILNEASFGFVKSTVGNPRGVNAARDRAIFYRQTHGWAYKTDITAFFDNIPRHEVVTMTTKALRAESFRTIIEAVVSCEIDDSDKALNRLASENGINRGRGLRQGMPLSPLLSNVLLKDFDREMLKRGYNMVRYADDLIVLASSRAECVEVDAYARKFLSKLGLTLPSLEDCTKTELVPPGDPIEFLGLSLQKSRRGPYRLLLTQDHIERIKRNISHLKNIERLLKEGQSYIDLGRKLENSIGGYRSAYRMADNLDELEAVLANIKLDSLRSVLISTFGESSVQKLSRAERIFMGIEAPESSTTKRKKH